LPITVRGHNLQNDYYWTGTGPLNGFYANCELTLKKVYKQIGGPSPRTELLNYV